MLSRIDPWWMLSRLLLSFVVFPNEIHIWSSSSWMSEWRTSINQEYLTSVTFVCDAHLAVTWQELSSVPNWGLLGTEKTFGNMRKHSGTGRVVVVSGTFDHNCPRSQAPIFVTVWLILLHVVRPVSLHIAMVGAWLRFWIPISFPFPSSSFWVRDAKTGALRAYSTCRSRMLAPTWLSLCPVHSSPTLCSKPPTRLPLALAETRNSPCDSYLVFSRFVGLGCVELKWSFKSVGFWRVIFCDSEAIGSQLLASLSCVWSVTLAVRDGCVPCVERIGRISCSPCPDA